VVATDAAARLRLEGALVAQDPPAVRLVAHNLGDAAAVDVTPQVAFEHRSYDGVPATIPPGAQHEWRLSLPPPTDGTVPAQVQVVWRDGGGDRRMVPLVVLVSTSGAAQGSVALAWALEPAAPVSHTRLSLENRGARPLAGRVAVALPGELTTEPKSQAITVAANGITTVPLAIESRSAAPGTYPVYAVFTYSDGGRPYAALASGDLTVKPSGGKRLIPLAVGAAARGVASGLLIVALKASRKS
jgi:hypothetical protein